MRWSGLSGSPGPGGSGNLARILRQAGAPVVSGYFGDAILGGSNVEWTRTPDPPPYDVDWVVSRMSRWGIPADALRRLLRRDVFGDSRTVLRGGYGVLYYHSANFEYPDTQGFSVATPFQSPQGAAFPGFQLVAGPPQIIQPSGHSLGPRSFLGNNVTYFETDHPTPTQQQWNLTAQRELPGATLIEVAYGSATVEIR